MLKTALYVRLEAKPGKEDEVESLPCQGRSTKVQIMTVFYMY